MAKATQRYTVLIYPDDGAYSVRVPALPGCVTWGATADEALAMAHDAIAVYVATLQDRGDDVPTEDGPLMVATLDVPIESPVAT